MSDGTDPTATDAPTDSPARSTWDRITSVADLLERSWDAARKRLTSRRPSTHDWKRHAGLSAVVVLALMIRSIQNSLDQALHRINPAGRPAVGLEALHAGDDATRRAFSTWSGGADRLEQFVRHDPVRLAVAQSLASLVLVPLIAVVLFVLARYLRTRIATEDGEKLLLCVSMVGTAAYLALGVADHVAELLVLANDGPVAVLTALLGATPWLRRLLIALILLPVVIVIIRHGGGSRKRTSEAWWRGAPTAYRTVLIIALLHLALLGFSVPGRQTEDALRLWASRVHLGVVGVVATALLSIALGLYATRIGSRVVQNREIMGKSETYQMIGVAVAFAVLGVFVGPTGLPLRPLFVSLAVVIGMTGFLSVPLVKSKPLTSTTPKEPSLLAREIVPGLVAAAPFLALTLALIRAAVPSLLDASAVERQTHLHLVVWSVVAGAATIAAYPIARNLARKDVAARREQRREAAQRTPAGDVTDPAEAVTEGSRPTPRLQSTYQQPERDWFHRYAIVLGLVSGGAAIVIVSDPVGRAPHFGVVAIIGLFLTIIVIAFGSLAVQFDGRALPASLDFVQFQKVPVFTGLIAVAVVSQAVADPDYHDVDTRDTAPTEAAQLTIDDAFERWSEAHAGSSSSGEAVPLVFVTAAGGGLKAAAFTSTVLDCVFAPTGESTVEPDTSDDEDGPIADVSEGTPEPDEAAERNVSETKCADEPLWDRVFALSGASGGSVGIASVMAASEVTNDVDQWVPDRLGKDLLSPSIAWQLFVEVPNAIAAFHPDDDRASILEATWRDQFDIGRGELPFYRPIGDGWTGPVAFFSGTNLEDGCRVNVSPIRAGSASPDLGRTTPFDQSNLGQCSARRVGVTESTDTADDADEADTVVIELSDQGDTYELTDFLCDENIDLATAAFLSARFPYVSPVATTSSCDDDILSIGDGGYRDNSGASTIAEVWSILEPLVEQHNVEGDGACIVPIWLEIGTGYAGLDGDGTSSNIAQTIAPAIGAAAVFGDLSYGAVEQLAAEFTRPLSAERRAVLGETGFSRHLRISLVDHPGVTAPLGWSLSPAAAEDFDQQLQVNENQEAVNRLSHILGDDSTLRCEAR